MGLGPSQDNDQNVKKGRCRRNTEAFNQKSEARPREWEEKPPTSIDIAMVEKIILTIL